MSSWTVIRDVSVNILVVEILLSVFACWMKSWPCSRIGGPRPRFGTGRWVAMCWLFLTSKSNLEACHMKLRTGLSGLIGPETVLREYPERSASKSVVKTFRSRRTLTSGWARRGQISLPQENQADIRSCRGTQNRPPHCQWGQSVPHGFHELQKAVRSYPSSHLVFPGPVRLILREGLRACGR